MLGRAVQGLVAAFNAASLRMGLSGATLGGRPGSAGGKMSQGGRASYDEYRRQGMTASEALRKSRLDEKAATGWRGYTAAEEAAGAKAIPKAGALYKIGTLAEKFAGAIAGVTTALVGSGMAIAGEALLRENEDSALGKFLVTWGNVITVVGSLTGIVLQLGPALLAASKSFFAMATTVLQTVIPALVAMARAAWASMAGSLGSIGKLGKYLAPVVAWFARLGPILGTIGGVLLNWGSKLLPLLGGAFEILSGPVGWLIGAATLLYTFWDDIVDVSKYVWEGFKKLGGWLADVS